MNKDTLDYALCKTAAEAYESASGSSLECEYLTRSIYDGLPGSAMVVAVRGTEGGGLVSRGGWVDMVRNAAALPIYSSLLGEWVHFGFKRGAERVVADLPSQFGWRDVVDRIYFTGHSLGAAMSFVMAELMWLKGWPVVRWAGFGCPHVYAFGGGKKKRSGAGTKTGYEKVSYRFEGDPITEIPTLLFWHPVPLTQIGDPEQGDSVFEMQGRDHSIATYLAGMGVLVGTYDVGR